MEGWPDAISKPWQEDLKRFSTKNICDSVSVRFAIWANYWKEVECRFSNRSGACDLPQCERIPPHIPLSQFPGQALAVTLYRDYGIRGVEIGTLMFGKKDPVAGRIIHPELEMVRLAIPRRVYTNMQISYVAESITELYQRRELVHGLALTYEAPVLRHFTARFAELQESSPLQAA